MTSILKVDTIQDTAGNNIINESGDTITIGASGDTITIPSGATISNLGTATGFGGVFETQLLHVRDEKASGTAGGGSTSGSFETRTLNTVMTNEISGASLSSNQIILPSGTYYIDATAEAFKAESHKLKLRNITDSSDVLIGTSAYASSGDLVANNSNVVGRFTISAQKTFEIQHRVGLTVATNGLGASASYSVVEVYTNVMIWKIA